MRVQRTFHPCCNGKQNHDLDSSHYARNNHYNLAQETVGDSALNETADGNNAPYQKAPD